MEKIKREVEEIKASLPIPEKPIMVHPLVAPYRAEWGDPYWVNQTDLHVIGMEYWRRSLMGRYAPGSGKPPEEIIALAQKLVKHLGGSRAVREEFERIDTEVDLYGDVYWEEINRKDVRDERQPSSESDEGTEGEPEWAPV